MKTNENKNIKIEVQYKEYRFLLDLLYEYEDKQHKLEETINALKNNPTYRGLHSKDYLENKEKEKKGIDLIIKGLSLLRRI